MCVCVSLWKERTRKTTDDPVRWGGGGEAQVAGCCMMGVTAAQVRVNAVSNETER